MTPNAKSVWRVGVAAVAAAVGVLATIFIAGADWRKPKRHDGPSAALSDPDAHVRRRAGKSLIVGLDAAERAWRVDPTPGTAWDRALFLDALAGPEVASDAWDDYLTLDPKSPRSDEARRKRILRTRVDAAVNERAAWEKHLAEWAEAVVAGRADAEAQALAALRSESRRHEAAFGDLFFADVVKWIDSLPMDSGKKVAAAEATLLLRAGRMALARRDVAGAESLLRKARRRLESLRSPLGVSAAVFQTTAMAIRLDFAQELTPTPAVDPCAPSRRYRYLCATQTWNQGLVNVRSGHLSAALSHYSRAAELLDQMEQQDRRASVLMLRAEVLDSMHAADEAWSDRLTALRTIRPGTAQGNHAVMRVAIAAARDGYVYASDRLLATLREDEFPEVARWRAYTNLRIDGHRVDADAFFGGGTSISGDSRFVRAEAKFASARRDVVNVSLIGSQVVHLSARSDWTEAIDLFAPENMEREAVGAMIATSVRRAYRDESDREVVNGCPETALWLSDRARLVGVPWKKTSSCLQEAPNASPAEKGRRLTACVPSGVTFVHQDLASSQLHTWIVRDGKVDLTTTWVSAPQLASDILRFRQAIEQNHSNVAIRPQAQKLYDVLFGPVRDKIRGSDLLVYSPSPELRGVPIAALHDGARFLIEARPLATTPTISVFALSKKRWAGSSALVALPPPGASRNVLVGASREARQVATMYPRTTLLTNDGATPSAFLEAVQLHEIIHVGTHGQTGALPYYNSIEFGKERIRAYDVFSLQLTRHPIVVIAACRSADSSGGPMNLSLTDAFLAAGASAVVGSLWDVEDRATEQLSVGFHRTLARGAAPHDALRSIQVQMLRGGQPVSAWAAFQLSS